MQWRQNVAVEKAGLDPASSARGNEAGMLGRSTYLDRTISPRVPMGRNGKDPHAHGGYGGGLHSTLLDLCLTWGPSAGRPAMGSRSIETEIETMQVR